MSQQGKKSPHYIERVDFSETEDILQAVLGDKYGEPFFEYRHAYYHSLDAKSHGEFPAFAHTVTIEFVNRCNLTCDMCYITNHTFPKAELDFKTIKGIIDQAAAHGRTGLLLGVGSEGLLYKPFLDVIAYAKNAGIMDVIIMTNGTLLTPEISEALVEEGVSRVCVSIDAATRETYEKVRGKDELERVEANVLGLVEVKKRQNSPLPLIRLSFCAIDINRHEQKAFREKWENVVDYIDYQKVADFSHVGDEDGVDLAGPVDPPEEERLFCTKPFGYLNVWSNGDISPCCNFYGKNLTFGNIKDDTLEDVYRGEKMTDLRNQFLGKKPLNKVCRVCLTSRENLIDGAVSS